MALLGNASGSSISTGSFARVLAADTLNVGGGIDSENGVLHIEGLITQGGVGSGTQGIAIGTNAGGGNTGSIRSVYIGVGAAQKITTGGNNVAIGYQAGGAFDTALGSHSTFVAIGSLAASKIKDNSSGFTMVGQGAGSNSVTATESTFIGGGAGANTLSGSYNTFVGKDAGSSAGNANGETPNNNIAVGYAAFSAAGDATYNVAVGDNALKNITGFDNVAIGKKALNDHIDGDTNIAIGSEAMGDAGQDGGVIDNQVAIGTGALKKLDTFGTLYANIAIGQNTAQSVVTSSFNTIMGYRALYSATGVGSANLVIGNSAAYSSNGTSFHANVILGDFAGYNTTGGDNVLIGEYAGHDLESGNANVVIGSTAAKHGNTFETNTNSVLVGYRTEASADGNTNENIFGYNTTGLGSNTVTLGNASVTDIYMASDSGATIHAAAISGSAGNLLLIGNISGSATSTGSFGVLQLNKFNAGIGDDSNINIGEGAGSTGASATSNIAIGFGAGAFSNAGSFINIAIGREAQGHWTDADGDRNIAIGYQSMYDHNGGDDNIAIGYQAMKNGEGDGSDNIAIGTDAMQAIGAGASRNVGIGDRVMHNLVGGTDNIGFGKDVLFLNVAGDYNVAVGSDALYGINAESADKNVAVGYRAGTFIADGSTNFSDGDSNVFIGSETKPAADDESNQIIIGANAVGKGSNTALIGDDNITDIYMSEDSGATIHAAAISGSAGNLALIGDISGSATSTGSFGQLVVGGTITIDDSTDEKLMLKGSNNPYIRLYEGTTAKAYLQWHSDGYVQIENQEASSTMRLTSDLLLTGGVSGSATSTGSFGQLVVGGANAIRIQHPTENTSVYIGHDAGVDDDGGNNNIAIGTDSMGEITNGVSNIALGHDSLHTETTGDYNVAIGDSAMANASNADDTIAIGRLAGKNLRPGSDYNIFMGHDSGENFAVGDQNIAIGINSMKNTDSGSNNIAIGSNTLNDATSSTDFNIAIGEGAIGAATGVLDSNIALGNSAMGSAGADGGRVQNCIAIGHSALKNAEIGQYPSAGPESNIAIGYQALMDHVTGSFNIAIGRNCMTHLGDSSQNQNDENIAIGYNALSSAENADQNVAIGADCMQNAGQDGLNSVSQNVAIGQNTLQYLQKGGTNVVIGDGAAQQYATGSNNVILGRRAAYNSSRTNQTGNMGVYNFIQGYFSGQDLDGGSYNVLLGYQSGTDLTTAGSVTAVGNASAKFQTTGGSGTYIGYNTKATAGAAAETVIGANAIGKGANTVTIGDDNITDIYLSEDSGATIHAGAISGSLGVVEIKGDISGSATSTGSFGTVEANHFTGDGAGLANVPDYVFEPEYVLRPLSEVESYVSQSKHLPGIPSMDEMDKWAKYSVGDRDMLLLEKIEELTLYTIKLNRRIEAQQKDIEELKNR